jgi:hypothetical protein
VRGFFLAELAGHLAPRGPGSAAISAATAAAPLPICNHVERPGDATTFRGDDCVDER